MIDGNNHKNTRKIHIVIKDCTVRINLYCVSFLLSLSLSWLFSISDVFLFFLKRRMVPSDLLISLTKCVHITETRYAVNGTPIMAYKIQKYRPTDVLG